MNRNDLPAAIAVLDAVAAANPAKPAKPAKLTTAQVSKLVAQYVTATATEGKSTVKRVRIVGQLVTAQAGTQAAIATLLVDALGAANLSINLDTARAQVGHAVTASKLLQRFGVTDDDGAVRAALSVSTGLIKSAVREEAFKGISSDDMTVERFVEICTALKAERKLKSAKPAKPAAEETEETETEEGTAPNAEAGTSLVDDFERLLKQARGMFTLAWQATEGDDAERMLSLFTEFSQELLG